MSFLLLPVHWAIRPHCVHLLHRLCRFNVPDGLQEESELVYKAAAPVEVDDEAFEKVWRVCKHAAKLEAHMLGVCAAAVPSVD